MTKSHKKGFTLVEMIVAVGLFSIVMFVASGALLSIINVNKKSQAQQSAINNMNFALESMARGIRTGNSYHCETTSGNVNGSGNLYYGDTAVQDCANGNLLVFRSDGSDKSGASDQLMRAYRFRQTSANGGIIEKTTNADQGTNATWLPINDPSIIIKNLSFNVSGTGPAPGDTNQPMVRINISGYAFVAENTGSPRRVDFSLQTLASQRRLDI